MAKHRAHRMHGNSLAAFRDLDIGQRKMQILSVHVRSCRALTDRDVARRLGMADMNGVRPRITEMIDAEILRQSGSTVDEETGRTVRLVEVCR